MQNNISVQRRSPNVLTLALLVACVAGCAFGAYSADNAATASPTAAPSLLELPTPKEAIHPEIKPAAPEATSHPANTPVPAAPAAAQPTPNPVVATPPVAQETLPATAEVPPPVAQPSSAAPPLPSLDKMDTTMKPVENSDSAPKIMEITAPVKLRLLEEPLHVPADFSLLFSKNDMNTIIIPSLNLFDQAVQNQAKIQKAGGGGDDLTGLLESLQITNKKVIQPLPNLYLGSIVYYSPTNWSVWINGKKLVNRLNKSSNILFVSNIDRSEAVFVWKPETLQDTGKTWDAKVAEGGVLPKNVVVEETKGTITFTLHPNQTFVPRTLTVSEGLIKQVIPVTQDAPAETAAPGKAGPPPPNPMIRKPMRAQ